MYHAAVGDTAIVFIRIATPRELGRCAYATAGPGELGRSVKIAKEQLHSTFLNAVRLLGFLQLSKTMKIFAKFS